MIIYLSQWFDLVQTVRVPSVLSVPQWALFLQLVSATIPKRASLQQAQRHSQNNIQDPFKRSGIK